jgi:hypothetical protein
MRLLLSVFIVLLLQTSKVIAQPEVPAKLQSLHNVNVFLFGLGYNYEQAIISNLSISAGAAVHLNAGYSYDWFTSDSKTWWGLYPSISIDPRWYTNFKKRAKKGKNINNNSADFVSLLFEYYPSKALIGTDELYFSTLMVSPRWGMRRSFFDQRFFIEFAAGLNFGITEEYTNNGLHLSLKAAFAFNNK